jgi:hypothetical protein
MSRFRPDLEASLPHLRACRALLAFVPDSLEEQPRLIELIRDEQTLPRFRRIHQAFGDALAREQMSRGIESLDP